MKRAWFEANRRLWDELIPIHLGSPYYDVPGFKGGRLTLHDIELAELGDVDGQDLLHLQCHIGLDTLSLAQLGARVIGVDFSEKAVDAARGLATDLGVDAGFVCSNVYDLPKALHARFDVVFTSWGVLCWLPDLRPWAEVVSRFLRPGGRFYLAEFHPILACLDEESLVPTEPYFHHDQPIVWEPETSAADGSTTITNPSHEWNHPIGDVVSALVNAGLVLEFLHEHPVSPEPLRSYLSQDETGWWRMKGDVLPLSFSLQARKPA